MEFKLPYERHIYSQHGEDGIIQVMVDAIVNPTKTFLEIGWGEGGNNMTRNLMDQGWQGVGIDRVDVDDQLYPPGFTYINLNVEPSTYAQAFSHTPKLFDFFSLDIDSFDYDVAAWMLAQGWRPKTVCVEINPKFGYTALARCPWLPPMKKKLYRKTVIYGASIRKYQQLWQHYGYCSFGFDSTATNAFFYHPDHVSSLDHLPQLAAEDFPYNNSDVVDQLLQQHSFWKHNIHLIYSEQLL
jgi:hypothetical protein